MGSSLNYMYSDSEKKNMQVRILITILSFCYLSGSAQNVTSPYSILGIGDIDTRDYSRYTGSGNAATGRRDDHTYNFSNPASLSALPLKAMHLDVALRGRSSIFTLTSGDKTDLTKDLIIKRISIAFKPDKKTGVAMGLKPYSSVNFKFSAEAKILDGNTTYSKFTEGTGGINQFYLSAGRSLGKHLSAGITASWLFGSLQRSVNYYSDVISLDITRTDHDFYTGAMLQAGLQYYTVSARKWKHTFGMTGSISTGLSGQLSSEYSESGTVITNSITNGRRFKLPASATVGYSAVHAEKLTLSAEASYSDWHYQKLAFKNSFTAPAWRLGAGLEYSFRRKSWAGLLEKSYVALGFNTERSYLRVNNLPLNDHAFTFGAGFRPTGSVSVYSGLEFGVKGGGNSGLIKENYTQYVMGITVKDIWVGTKKFGRFN